MNEELSAWQLTYLSKAYTRAIRLEKLRQSFHQELYECIVVSTSLFDRYASEKRLSSATDSQAIRIVEAKERYERKIKQEYVRYARWTKLLENTHKEDRIIMIRYFQKEKYVRPEVVADLLERIKEHLQQEEILIDETRTEKANMEYRSYLDTNGRRFNKKKKRDIFLTHKAN